MSDFIQQFDSVSIDLVGAGLSKTDIEELESLGVKIRGSKRVQVSGILEMGHYLDKAFQRLCPYGKGLFKDWVYVVCGFGERTAENYIRVYKAFGGPDRDMIAANFFSPSALYVLSRKSNSEACAQAVELAENGAFVSLAMADHLVKVSKENLLESNEEPQPSSSQPATESAARPQVVDEVAVADDIDDDLDDDILADEEEVEEAEEDEEDETEEDLLEKTKATKRMCLDLISRAVRAVDDYHHLRPNSTLRTSVVNSLKQAKEKLW